MHFIRGACNSILNHAACCADNKTGKKARRSVVLGCWVKTQDVVTQQVCSDRITDSREEIILNANNKIHLAIVYSLFSEINRL